MKSTRCIYIYHIYIYIFLYLYLQEGLVRTIWLWHHLLRGAVCARNSLLIQANHGPLWQAEASPSLRCLRAAQMCCTIGLMPWALSHTCLDTCAIANWKNLAWKKWKKKIGRSRADSETRIRKLAWFGNSDSDGLWQAVKDPLFGRPVFASMASFSRPRRSNSWASDWGWRSSWDWNEASRFHHSASKDVKVLDSSRFFLTSFFQSASAQGFLELIKNTSLLEAPQRLSRLQGHFPACASPMAITYNNFETWSSEQSAIWYL